MKRLKMWCILIGLMVMGSCSFEPKVLDGEFLIEGYLKNVDDGAIIMLYQFENNTGSVVGCDTVVNGRFSFRDTITCGVRKLSIGSISKGFPGAFLNIWVASSTKTVIEGEDEMIPVWQVHSVLKEQKDQSKLYQVTRKEWYERASLSVKQDSLRSIRNQYNEKDVEYKQAKLQIDSIKITERHLMVQIYKKQLEVLKEMPVGRIWMETYVDLLKLLTFDGFDSIAQDIRSLYKKLSESDKQTELGKICTEYMNLPVPIAEGDEMVDGDLFDVNGNLHHLSEFKGKYILLDFWSIGCGPCIASLPEMEEIIELYKGRMEVVGISIDPENLWKSFVKEKQMKGNQWNELRKGNTGLTVVYKVDGYPCYVMISPDGKVKKIWKGYGKGALKKQVKELLQ
jgi:thiol-disulfide isomerase/thioredoxin